MARAKTPGTETAPPTPPPTAAPAQPWAQVSTGAGAQMQPHPGDKVAYFLVHSPGAYTSCDGWCVPELSQFCAGEAGVEGVEAVRVGNRWVADPAEAIQRMAARGVRVIPWEVDAPEHASYLVPVGNTGTWAHRLQAQVPGMRPRPAPRSAYAGWLLSLVERGILAAPHPEQVRAVGERLGAIFQTNDGTKSKQQAKGMLAQWELYQARALKEQVEATDAA
jgi:hypothetical protein